VQPDILILVEASCAIAVLLMQGITNFIAARER
jgi:hypothetical protein